MRAAAVVVFAVGCATSHYDKVTAKWTSVGTLRGEYQQVLDLKAVLMTEEWRVVHAERDADHRKLEKAQRDALVAQVRAETAGPYVVELLVTTWDRKENDLDRGKRSVWRVVLVGEQGKEIEPLEIIKDKRPINTLRAEFPTFGDFATAYIARFPHSDELGHKVRLRMSGERGGVEVSWDAP
jgi:hypothetical protein